MALPDGFLKNSHKVLDRAANHIFSQKIKVARSFGDLLENSEYDEAKNEQAKIEARIAALEMMLKDVQIIWAEEQIGDKAHIGSKVKVLEVEIPGGTVQIKIVDIL